ncbi:MAG: SGNH/GDSL hydrolase family protein [Gammaproteobacteria bacterium]|nr:SGNH/GDSL hydrolase family protein [Gammaproteobacteria bacterium]
MKKILFSLILSLYLTSAFAVPYKKIVILGDSLSDNGNLYKLDAHFLPKSPPYFKGRFSNGDVWSDTLTQRYFDRYQVTSTNYAYGGATSTNHNPVTDPTLPITLTSELNDYLLKALFQKKSDTLFIIWIGANDYLFDKSVDPELLTTRVVDEIKKTVDTLVQDHAQFFLVLNLPDISKTPLSRGQGQLSERLHTLSLLHNQKLAALIAQAKEKYPNVKFVTVDIAALFDDLLNNPDKYNQLYHVNIHDVINPCWPGGYTHLLAEKISADNAIPENIVTSMMNSPDLYEAMSVSERAAANEAACVDPDNRVFWDRVHPSAPVHQILADVIDSQLLANGL